MVQVNHTTSRQIFQVGLFVFLVGIDQFSKWCALHQDIFVVYNYGVSFGWLLLPTVWQTLIIGVLLTVITVGWWQCKQWYLTIILAGGWSNWFDRVLTGAVVDWLPIPGTTITNNIADYWIAIGMLCLLVSMLFSQQRNKT